MGRSDKARVLVVHNAYQQRGGEDSVVEAEVALLKQHGHDVQMLLRHNDDVDQMSRVSVAVQTMWSRPTTCQVTEAVQRFRPDVVHVHNAFPLVSPSVFWTARDLGVPTVMTLHNFRLLCPQATLLREGRVCERCVGRFPWEAVVHGCYRESRVQSAAVAMMLGLHRVLGTYASKVNRYIALNEFCRSKFIEGGLPSDRIVVKPNFVDGVPRPQNGTRKGGLYVGRLSVEKGIQVLLSALQRYPTHDVEIVGSGPDESQVRAVVGQTYQGAQPLAVILSKMQSASYLVIPSVCYEGFPRTLVEAFASGLPVIASRHGSLAELIDEGHTGLLFEPGDSADLLAKLQWADAHPEAMRAMGQNARMAYEQSYTAERNYELLCSIYDQAREAETMRG